MKTITTTTGSMVDAERPHRRGMLISPKKSLKDFFQDLINVPVNLKANTETKLITKWSTYFRARHDTLKFMTTRLSLLTSFFLFLSLTGLSQKHQYDTTVFIGGFQTSKFYAGEFNALGVYSPNYDIKSLVIKASQGKLENIDDVQNGFLSLTKLKLGNVAINVFKTVDTGLLLLNKRVFKVINRPLSKEEQNTAKLTDKPRITIASFTDSIPIETIKRATKIDINEPFKIKSLTFILYTRRKVYDGTSMLALQSGDFDENVLHIVNRMKPGNELGIMLDDIRVVDFRGKVYALKSMNFKVVD